MSLWFGSFKSLIGPLTVAVNSEGTVKQLHFGEILVDEAIKDDQAIAHVRTQLDDYFAGGRRTFDLRLSPDGTEFQRAVWAGLLTIPFGQTLSYGALAERVGRPGAFRAVGAANGANPIPVIVPCHRVIGRDRTLTGFGGGIAAKAKLLAHEGVLARELVSGAMARTRVAEQARLI